jgi:hypothetical protein
MNKKTDYRRITLTHPSFVCRADLTGPKYGIRRATMATGLRIVPERDEG